MSVRKRVSVRPASQSPKISVIVPLYNYEDFIGDCIHSLKRQTYLDFEVIIVDDASTDRSLAVAELLTADDARFRVVRNATNKGLPATRNVGMRCARAPYIMHVDADDFVAANAIQRLAQASEMHRDDVIGFGHTFYSGPRQARVHVEPHVDRISTNFLIEPKLWDFCSVCRYIYSTDFIEQHDLFFDEEVQLGEDQIYLSKALPRARSCTLLPDPLIFYRVGHRSMSTFSSDWRWKEDCGLWPAAVAANIKPLREIYNFFFLRVFHRYIEKLATAHEVLPGAEADEIIGLFCEAFGDVDLGYAAHPESQPWRDKVYVPQEYMAALSAVVRRDRTALAEQLKDIATRFSHSAIFEARDLNHARQFEKGVEVLQAAIKAKPSHAGLEGQLAETLFQLARFDEAKTLVRSAIEKEPETKEYLEILYRLSMRASDALEAVKAAEKMQALDPFDPKVSERLGRAHLSQGKAVAARRCCDRAGAVARSITGLMTLRSEAERARGRPVRAMQCAMIAVKRAPFDSEAHVCLAKRLSESGDHEQAASVLKSALNFAPQSGNTHMVLAHLLAHAGDINGAIEAAEKAIALNGDAPEWHAFLTNLHVRAQDWQKAEDCVRRQIERSPNNALAYNTLSGCLQAQGRLEEAAEAAREAIARNSRLPGWHVNLANLMLRQEDWEAAEISARKAIALSKDCAPAYRTLSSALLKAGHPDAAIGAGRKAIELKADVPEWHVHLANLYIRRHKWAEAIASAQRSIDLENGYAPAFRSLSSALVNAGNIDEAVAAAKTAVHLNGDVPEWRRHLAGLVEQQDAWARTTSRELQPTDSEIGADA